MSLNLLQPNFCRWGRFPGYGRRKRGNILYRRKRFTIAHEIAHIIFHRDKIGAGLVDDALYRSRLSNTEEIEANKLAAQILMPWNLINQYMDANAAVQSLAEIFDLSDSAMAIRLGIPC